MSHNPLLPPGAVAPLRNPAAVIILLSAIKGAGGGGGHHTGWMLMQTHQCTRIIRAHLVCLHEHQVNPHSYRRDRRKSVWRRSRHTCMYTGAFTQALLWLTDGFFMRSYSISQGVHHYMPTCCDLSMHNVWNIEHQHMHAKLSHAQRLRTINTHTKSNKSTVKTIEKRAYWSSCWCWIQILHINGTSGKFLIKRINQLL